MWNEFCEEPEREFAASFKVNSRPATRISDKEFVQNMVKYTRKTGNNFFFTIPEH